MTKLISMSLYGDSDQYIDGAIKNIELAKKFYPDWTLRIYCAEDYGLHDCETVIMGQSKDHSGMFWRFLPAWEEEITIFRDTDSRFNVREVAAVKAWLNSKYHAHAMHDHEHHRSYPLFGGMWGTRKLENVGPKNTLWAMIKVTQSRVSDMDYLRKYIYPVIAGRVLHHSSHSIKWPYQAFPPHVPYTGFVGQQF